MTPSALLKFALDTSAGEPSVLLGDAELEIVDVGDDGHVLVEIDQAELATASFEDFPASLTVQIHSSDGFGMFLFHEAHIFRANDGRLMGEYICHQPNKYWEGAWGLATFLGAIRDQVPFHQEVTVGDIELEDDWKRLTLLVPLSEGPATEALH